LTGVIATLAVRAIIHARQQATAARRRADLARWKTQVWPEERKLEIERIQSRQAVDDTVNAAIIDLSPYINAKLTDAPAGWKGDNADNLAELPAGKNIYGGVPFDVEGSIQLMGGWFKHYHKTYPARVDDIRIGRHCAKLHLLQGNCYITYTNFGTVVSKLVLHYVDGSSRQIDLIAGKQAFDWWNPLFKTGLPKNWFQPAPGTERAWTGSNAYLKKWQPEFSLVLYKTTLDNPQPKLELSSLDYVSTETITCPFLVGLTVE
jgi:hypothetical protein